MEFLQQPTRRQALATFAGGLVAPRLFAQAGEGAVFSAGVDVVNILATVRDKKGTLITDLSKDDFRLEEDGKPQQIQYFAQLTDLPLTVGLLIDTSRSQMRILEEEQKAGKRFFDRVIDESKDQAFVISFDFEVTLIEDLTSSRAALRAALGGLRPMRVFRGRNLVANQQFPGGIPLPGGGGGRRRPQGGGRPGPPPGGGRGGRGGIGTALYDAVYLAANDVLAEQSGRKAIVLISDGVDMGSKLELEEAVEAALRADTVVYSIYYVDDDLYHNRGGGRNGAKVLRQMSEETGGRMDEVSKNLSLTEIFEQIETELRSQYSLGYVPSQKEGRGFRAIDLQVRKGKYEVFTRSGYYPESS